MNTNVPSISARHYYSWDWICIVCTILVNVAFIFTLWLLWTESVSIFLLVIPTIIVGFAVVFALSLCPCYVERRGELLTVRCLLYRRSFDLRSCSLVFYDRAPTKGMIRSFGSGGYFGYTGYFYSPTLGHCFVLLTHYKRSCLLIRNAQGRQSLIHCPLELVSDFPVRHNEG